MTASDRLDNPLLIGQGLPRFASIGAEHVVDGIRRLLHELASELEELEAAIERSTRMFELIPESRSARSCLLLAHHRLSQSDEALSHARAIATAAGLAINLPADSSHEAGLRRFLAAAVDALLDRRIECLGRRCR